MAARFARQKDHATLLDSLSFLKKKNVLVPLYLAGTGKKNIIRQSQSLADRLGLSETVHFLGRVEKMPNLLMQHRIFVLSSHYEGMPLALLEAMACGCACIGTDVVGIREVIEHDRTGILVPEGNPQALADAIVSLITHPERAEALGLAARQTAKERFASDLMHARYAQLLSHLHTQHLESRPSKK
jgi:glycosyltransferase involved in cell wall biosynthesis